jgi:hypothetical protein
MKSLARRKRRGDAWIRCLFDVLLRNFSILQLEVLVMWSYPEVSSDKKKNQEFFLKSRIAIYKSKAKHPLITERKRIKERKWGTPSVVTLLSNTADLFLLHYQTLFTFFFSSLSNTVNPFLPCLSLVVIKVFITVYHIIIYSWNAPIWKHPICE